MKEAYCSYETAKLLKEKGFSGDMNHYISHHNTDGTSEAIATCTHQMACAWLREVHNIFITIYCGRNGVLNAVTNETKKVKAAIDNQMFN